MSKNILEKPPKSKLRVRKPKVKGVSKKPSRKPKRVRKSRAKRRAKRPSKKAPRKSKRIAKRSKRTKSSKSRAKRSKSRAKRSKRMSKKAPSKSKRVRKRIVSKRRGGRPRKNSVKRSPKTSPRARKRSPRARKRSPKARKRSPKARKRSPRARKRSPKARKASPQAPKASPQARKASPQPPKKASAKAVINGLTWTGNSCYIDSLFICLLAVPNTFIDKNILNKRLREGVYDNFSCNSDPERDLEIRQEIRDELRELTANIRGASSDKVITCTNFRRIIKACKTSNKNLKFYGKGEQDPVEFLEYICNIFGIRYTATFNEDPIGYLAISYPDFRAYTFDRRLHRKATWTPPKTTRTGSNVVQLSSVITYTPGHYTCFFRIGAVWYFYNDMSDPFVKTIGSYGDLLDASVSRYKINVQTHGVLYFYTL